MWLPLELDMKSVAYWYFFVLFVATVRSTIYCIKCNSFVVVLDIVTTAFKFACSESPQFFPFINFYNNISRSVLTTEQRGRCFRISVLFGTESGIRASGNQYQEFRYTLPYPGENKIFPAERRTTPSTTRERWYRLGSLNTQGKTFLFSLASENVTSSQNRGSSKPSDWTAHPLPEGGFLSFHSPSLYIHIHFSRFSANSIRFKNILF